MTAVNKQISEQAYHQGINPEVNADKSAENNGSIEQFSNITRHFIDSYALLEKQVANLNSELDKQKALKQEEVAERIKIADRLERIMATLPSAVVVIDGHGMIREYNALAENMLGKPLNQQSWLSVISRAFAPRSDDGHEISLKDGRRVKVETRALDSEPGQIVVLTDLTETRELQENQFREQRLAVIGKMMASLAHQIRTPLSSALLYSSHITSQKLEPKQQQRFQLNLQHALNQLQRQVSDMLLFASGGVSTKERFDLSSFMTQLKADIRTNSIHSEGKLQLESKLTSTELNNYSLYGNCQALLGAIANLIDNAMHACRSNNSENKPVDIKVKLNLAGEELLEISVSDNGQGIELSDLTQVFEPFFTSKARGTGLGLAVVKTVVNNFNGHIDITSKVNRGTEITMQLPIRSAESEAECLTNPAFKQAVGGL